MFRIPFSFFRYFCSAQIAIIAFTILAWRVPAALGAQVALSWQDNSSNETGFKIERATGSGSFAQIATKGSGVESHTDTTAAASTTYRYRVRAYNAAGNSPYSNTTTVTTASSSANTAPTISDMADRTIAPNGTTGAIAFTIGDAQTAASSLTLTKNASNPSLVPLANITFGGSGASRTVTVRPASSKTGWSTIWVKVSDGSLSTYVSFILTVRANTAPTISAIADRIVSVNGTTGAIPFTIGDAETAAASLTLIKNASNQSVVPLGNITFGGSGSNRTVTVRPASNKTGWSTVWVKVSDGQLDRYVGFVVSVQATQTFADVGSSSASSMQVTATGPDSTTPSSTPASSDNLRFGYLPLTGDVELAVQVTSLADLDDETRAGLMFRNSTRGDAACVGLYLTGASRVALVWRPEPGAPLQTVAPLTGTVPAWLRLTRVGDAFYGFTSSDGRNWEFVDFADVDLVDAALGGTAVTTSAGPSASTATFANFGVD